MKICPDCTDDCEWNFICISGIFRLNIGIIFLNNIYVL